MLLCVICVLAILWGCGRGRTGELLMNTSLPEDFRRCRVTL